MEIDKIKIKDLKVTILPFSKIDEIGAGMYKGVKISQAERHYADLAQGSAVGFQSTDSGQTD